MRLGRWIKDRLPDYMVYAADKHQPIAPPQETSADYGGERLQTEAKQALGEVAVQRSVSPENIPVMPIALPEEDYRRYE